MKKNKIVLAGLIGLVLAGCLFLGACDIEKSSGGKLNVYNLSIYASDANVVMTLFQDSSSIAGPRTLNSNQYWTVTDCPTDTTLRVRIVDMNDYTTWSSYFSIPKNGTKTLRYYGTYITID